MTPDVTEKNSYDPDDEKDSDQDCADPRLYALGYSIGLANRLETGFFSRFGGFGSFSSFLSVEHGYEFSGAGAVPPRRTGAHHWPVCPSGYFS